MANPENIVKHQFKPGHKAKGGRPKGSKDLTRLLEKLLNKEMELKQGEKTLKKKPRELIILALIREAASGNVKAISQIFDRLEGKAVQKIAGSEDDPPIQVESAIKIYIPNNERD